MKKITLDSGNVINWSTIEELVEMEMSEGSHTDYTEDYDSYLDFCLSAFDEDKYIAFLKDSYFNDIDYSEEDLQEIEKLVIDEIKSRIED